MKPTFTFSYVLAQSNHTNYIFKNIPKSIFFRIRRMCTYISDYLHFSHIFYKEFLKKGYDKNIVIKTIRMISDLDRDKIIPYNLNKNKIDFFDKLFFKLPYSFNYLNLEKFFINYNKTSDFFSSFLNYYNLKLDKPFSTKFTKCNSTYCNFCVFADSNSYLKLNNFYLPSMNSNCRSLNLNYIIYYCKTCFRLYIGQTNYLRNRFLNHKRNILTNNIKLNTDLNDGQSLVNIFVKKIIL